MKFILGLVCALEAHFSCILLAIALVVGPLVRGISSKRDMGSQGSHSLTNSLSDSLYRIGEVVMEIIPDNREDLAEELVVTSRSDITGLK